MLVPAHIVIGLWYGLRISDDFDLRFPFGGFHWDAGPAAVITFVVLLPFALIPFTGSVEAYILWTHRHEPITHGPRKCASAPPLNDCRLRRLPSKQAHLIPAFGCCRYSWWAASAKNRKLQPGIWVAAVTASASSGLVIFYNFVILMIPYYEDRAQTKIDHCMGDSCFSNS